MPTPSRRIPPPTENRPASPPLKRRALRRLARRGCLPLLVGMIFLILLLSSLVLGARSGLQEGHRYRQAIVTELAVLSLQEQYELAVQDLAQGRYEVARQRLEYVLEQSPNHPQAANRLAEAVAVLYATATPTPLPPTITPTPTRDLRPVEDLFAQAQLMWVAKDWDAAIDTLLALRQSDPAYQTTRVDGMLFMALRERGVAKIWTSGNLQGGIYDLALAARFAPLDAQASNARSLARLYLTGSGFVGVYPAEAIKYFSQVAAAAPGLHDASGVSAAQRYREALAQYGDQLAGEGRWCEAQEQYQAAYQQGAPVEDKLREAILRCSPPTNTPRPTELPTATLPGQPTPSDTSPAPPTETPPVNPPTVTQAPPTNTVPVEPTATSAPPTNTEAPPPSETPAPPTATSAPPPTDTEAPPPTEPLPPPPTHTSAPLKEETPTEAALPAIPAPTEGSRP